MSADIELNWEWPADRAADQKILIKVTDIKKQSSGFFGIKKSPSLAQNLPDPMVLSATLIGNESNLKNKTLELVLPKVELGEIKNNDIAILGVIAGKTCICIKAAESENTDPSTINCP